MKSFFKLIPIFYLAYQYVDFFFKDLWTKSPILQFFIGIPLVVLFYNLMRFIELLIMFSITRKVGSVISSRSKKISFCFNLKHVYITILRVKQNESSFLVRKIFFHNVSEIKSEVKFYKSIITKKYYVIDSSIFLAFFFKIVSLSFIIFLFM
jgi:hypothetical protein